MLILLIVLTVTASGALIAQIRKDGYGSRPGPRSHYDSLDPRSFAN